MKKIITLFLFLIISSCFSQKIKLKDKLVLVDDVAWLNYQDCGSFDRTCSLLNSKNDEIIFIKFFQIEGAEPISSANSSGTLVYQEVKFLGYNKSFEVKMTQKDILRLLYNSKVIGTDGQLDDTKAAILVEKYGQEYSARLNKQQQNNQTIIIEQPAPHRSGININLGR